MDRTTARATFPAICIEGDHLLGKLALEMVSVMAKRAGSSERGTKTGGGGMKVIIIGGTGFIGPYLLSRLINHGNEVAVFHRGKTKTELPPGVEQILGDRHDLGSHVAEFRRFKPDLVVDMIAFTKRDAIGLAETFRGLAGRSIVISSADVYRAYGRFIGSEPGPIEPTPLGEDAPLRTALFPYRKQAKGTDDFLSSYDKIPVERAVMGDPDLPGTVLRLPMVHGPGDSYRRLSPYLKRMDDGRPAIVLDEGLARWKCPRGHVEDVAAAIALAVVDERAAGRIYNITEPVAFTEAEWICRIGEVVGWRGEVVTVPGGRIPLPYRIEQSLDTDSGRIRRELGHTEVLAPQAALEQTVAWERASPAGQAQGIGLLDYDAEDALLAEFGHR
jgi:nucleoside-diphosphate-sugar epimerase